MSYNGSGTFTINSTGQPVVAGTVITASAFNALTTDLATGLTTAITKDGQTTTTARITFAQGLTSSLVTDSSSVSTGSIITDGGVGIAKNLYVGGLLNVAGATSFTNPTINNIKMGYTTTATAAGTTTLTISSNYRQFFTGTTTQTIVLPVTSTLVTGIAYEIENNSTGTLTVNSSGGNLVGTIPAGVCAHAVCIGTTLTTAADWDWDYISTTTITGTGANVLGTSPTIATPTITGDASISGLTVGKGTNGVTGNSAFGVGILTSGSLSGGYNTAIGFNALAANTSGTNNTGIGNSALNANTTGADNQAFGTTALFLNTTGSSNTAVGRDSLRSNTTASNNTAVGYQSLYAQTGSAGPNDAFGKQSGYSTTQGYYNASFGNASLYSTTTGYQNTAIGQFALYSNTTASNNTAVGYQAGYAVTTGQYNCLLGYITGTGLTTGGGNTFVGGGGCATLVTTGSNNTVIGNYSGNQGGIDIRTASNNIVLSDGAGNPRLTYLSGAATWYSVEIYNSTTASAANINVSSGGNISRSTSALKYKQDIRDIENIDISKFRPVRYKSKCANDDQTKDHFGIVADEVDAAGIKELVNYGADGEVEGFQYERLTVVLLKSLQELKTIVDTQAAEIAELKAKVA